MVVAKALHYNPRRALTCSAASDDIPTQTVRAADTVVFGLLSTAPLETSFFLSGEVQQGLMSQYTSKTRSRGGAMNSSSVIFLCSLQPRLI